MSDTVLEHSDAKRGLVASAAPHYYRAGHYGIEASSPGVTLALIAQEDRFNMEARRGKAARLVASVHKIFGVAPVQAPLTVSTGDVDFVGVGVSRWHVISRAQYNAQLHEKLREATDGLASLVDVSHGFTTFQLSGAFAAQALAKLVRCDLDGASFPPGACAATEAHGMSLQLRRRLRNDVYECAVPRSFGGSLFHALVTAAEQFGIYAAELPENARINAN
ncbi:MAG: sarcosine oxidase subunit gamma family protein [Pseudomonadota bacterium]